MEQLYCIVFTNEKYTMVLVDQEGQVIVISDEAAHSAHLTTLAAFHETLKPDPANPKSVESLVMLLETIKAKVISVTPSQLYKLPSDPVTKVNANVLINSELVTIYGVVIKDTYKAYVTYDLYDELQKQSLR